MLASNRTRLVVVVLAMGATFAAAAPPAARPVTRQAASRPAAGARPNRGEVLAVDATSITAIPMIAPMDNEPGGPRTYAIDAATRVDFARVVSDHADDAGRRTQEVKLEPASVADLKVGQRVRIVPDGERAARIMIQPEDDAPPATTRP